MTEREKLREIRSTELWLRIEKWYESVPKPVNGSKVIDIIYKMVIGEKSQSCVEGLRLAEEITERTPIIDKTGREVIIEAIRSEREKVEKGL